MKRGRERAGGIGCSTSEKPPPVSSDQAMNLTPSVARLTALPLLGPTILGPSEPSKRVGSAFAASILCLLVI